MILENDTQGAPVQEDPIVENRECQLCPVDPEESIKTMINDFLKREWNFLNKYNILYITPVALLFFVSIVMIPTYLRNSLKILPINTTLAFFTGFSRETGDGFLKNIIEILNVSIGEYVLLIESSTELNISDIKEFSSVSKILEFKSKNGKIFGNLLASSSLNSTDMLHLQSNTVNAMLEFTKNATMSAGESAPNVIQMDVLMRNQTINVGPTILMLLMVIVLIHCLQRKAIKLHSHSIIFISCALRIFVDLFKVLVITLLIIIINLLLGSNIGYGDLFLICMLSGIKYLMIIYLLVETIGSTKLIAIVLWSVSTISGKFYQNIDKYCNVFRWNRVPNCLKTPEKLRILDLPKVLP